MAALNNVTVMILAGGMGTRLRKAVPDVQKAVAPVNARPFMLYLLDRLERCGFHETVICSGHKADTLKAALTGYAGAQRIRISHEEVPLGTGGAVKLALTSTETDLTLVLNGDSFFNCDLERMLCDFTSRNLVATLAVTEVDDVARYGAVDFSDNGTLLAFREKGGRSGRGWINAGIYCLRKREMGAWFPGKEVFSLERNVFPAMAAAGRLGCFRHHGRFIDIGTPESYNQAKEFFHG